MGLISGIPSTSRTRVMRTPVAVGRVGDVRASGGALTAVPAQAPLKSSHAVTASIRTALEGDSGRNPDADDGVPGSSSARLDASAAPTRAEGRWLRTAAHVGRPRRVPGRNSRPPHGRS